MTKVNHARLDDILKIPISHKNRRLVNNNNYEIILPFIKRLVLYFLQRTRLMHGVNMYAGQLNFYYIQ